MLVVILIGIDIEVEVSLQPDAVLVVGSDSPVGFLTRERREEALVEELARTIAHRIVDPRVTVGVLEDLRCGIGTLLPRSLIREEGRRHRRVVDRTARLPGIVLVVLGQPSAARIGHLVGLTLVIDIAHREEDLVLVGVIQDIIIHQTAILIEEIEAEAPALEAPTDDADVVGALLLVVLLEVGHRTLTLHLNGGPRASVVVDDDELLLLPGGIRVDEVPVHHTVTVGVAFLEHHETRRPVLERTLGIGVGKGFGDLDLRDTIDVAVGATVGDGLRVERVVVVVGVDVPEDELIARTEREGDEAKDSGALEVLTDRSIHSEEWALHKDDIATIAIEEGFGVGEHTPEL